MDYVVILQEVLNRCTIIANGVELAMELFHESKPSIEPDGENVSDIGVNLSELSNTELVELLIDLKEYKGHRENILQTFINKELSRRGLV